MKRLLVILLISSILLSQCYTQKEYLTRDYKFNQEDDLKSIVLTDSTVREFGRNEYSYEIESDDKLITTISKREKFGDFTRTYSVTDTLTLSEVHSIFISEYDGSKTTYLIVLGGLVLIGVLFWASGGIWGDDKKIFSGMGSF